jgi:hypothetical protein
MNKYKPIHIIFLFLCISYSSGCDKKKNEETGVLKGTISIGPLCPVVRDPPCSPTAETYKAYQVDVYSAEDGSKIAELNPSLDGSFSTDLPAGNYILNFESGTVTFAQSNLPLEISIKKTYTTSVSINIDTGIR